MGGPLRYQYNNGSTNTRYLGHPSQESVADRSWSQRCKIRLHPPSQHDCPMLGEGKQADSPSEEGKKDALEAGFGCVGVTIRHHPCCFTISSTLPLGKGLPRAQSPHPPMISLGPQHHQVTRAAWDCEEAEAGAETDSGSVSESPKSYTSS